MQTDLPDLPDDIPLGRGFPDLSDNRGWLGYYIHQPDAEGLSFVQREEIRRKKEDELLDKKLMAQWTRDDESLPWPCMCDPECIGPECKANVQNKKAAEEKYRKTMAELAPKKSINSTKKSVSNDSQGPSIATSRSAASALSQKSRSTIASKSTGIPTNTSKKILPILSKGKKIPPPANPSAMRHTAASAASKTTIGYSKGRAASAAMRRSILPAEDKDGAQQLDADLPPALHIHRFGMPEIGSRQWRRCKEAGFFKDEDEEMGSLLYGDDGLADTIREEAMKEFVLEV